MNDLIEIWIRVGKRVESSSNGINRSLLLTAVVDDHDTLVFEIMKFRSISSKICFNLIRICQIIIDNRLNETI